MNAKKKTLLPILKYLIFDFYCYLLYVGYLVWVEVILLGPVEIIIMYLIIRIKFLENGDGWVANPTGSKIMGRHDKKVVKHTTKPLFHGLAVKFKIVHRCRPFEISCTFLRDIVR